MEPTPASLLDRLRHPDPLAWERFVALYTPLLRRWAGKLGADGDEAADLIQDVLTILVRSLPEFRYDPNRRFRGWLWTVTANKWRELRRRSVGPTATPDELAALAVSDAAEAVDAAEYNRYLTAQAMRIMRTEFPTTHWQAFWESAVEGRPAAEIAARLGVSADVVYTAKSRILRRLRAELAGLLD